MAVSNFHGTNPLVTHAPVAVDLQRLSGFKGEEYFDGRELFAHGVREVQKIAKTLTELFEQNVSPSQKSEPVLSTLPHRILHWFDSEKDSKLVERSFPFISKSSCVTGLVIGTFSSLLTQHPLPLLLGLSQCFLRAQAQQKIGSEFQVNNYTASNQQFPSVASFPNGNFVVVWESDGQDGSRYGIFGQSFDENGSKIGNEFQVNTVTSSAQEYPSVASVPNGDFIVVWQSDVGASDFGIYSQIFNGSGTKISNEIPVRDAALTQTFPVITSLRNGSFIISWNDGNWFGQGWEIWAQIFNGTGTLIKDIAVTFGVSGDQEFPSVASLENGNFIIVWQNPHDSANTLGIFGQLFNESDSKVGSEFRINSYALDDQCRPAVASFKNGNFVVTWESKWQDGDLYGIYGQLFDGNGKKIGGEFQANTEVVQDQYRTDVASLSNNHCIVTWQSGTQDGSSWGVYGQLFDENAVKIGNEFQINTYTADDQSRPSVASLQDENFVVTWHSYGQDGSGFGIFGQIFHDNFTFTSSTSTTSTSQTTTTILPSTITTSIAFTSSSSTIYRTTETSTIRSTTSTTNPITTDRSPVTSDGISKGPSPSPNRNNNFLWFLLGASGWAACLALTGYLFYKSKRREEGGDTVELREKGSPDRVAGFTARESEEEHYQRTPDHVHPE